MQLNFNIEQVDFIKLKQDKKIKSDMKGINVSSNIKQVLKEAYIWLYKIERYKNEIHKE